MNSNNAGKEGFWWELNILDEGRIFRLHFVYRESLILPSLKYDSLKALIY